MKRKKKIVQVLPLAEEEVQVEMVIIELKTCTRDLCITELEEKIEDLAQGTVEKHIPNKFDSIKLLILFVGNTMSFNLTIQIPTEDYEEPESIKQEGQGSFKIEEKLSGKKRKAEGFSNDLPKQDAKREIRSNY